MRDNARVHGVDLAEHRHRFSAWAAARAAQRKLKGATVEILRDALEGSGVVAFLGADRQIDENLFDALHREWCHAILAYLASRGVQARYGRAAKLIAVYLKGMVILGEKEPSRLSYVAHPPIDAILLRNISKSPDVSSPRKSSWKKVRWTQLDEYEYYRLINELRTCLKESDPFWILEEHWNVTDE